MTATATAYRLTPYQRGVLLDLAHDRYRSYLAVNVSPPGAMCLWGRVGVCERVRFPTAELLIARGWVEPIEMEDGHDRVAFYRLSDAGAKAIR